MTYEEYAVNFIRKMIDSGKSLQEISNLTGLDKAIVSKIANGKYIPKKKTFEKWFGPITEELEGLPAYEPRFIFTGSLNDFVENLDSLGYKLLIVKKESSE